MDGKDDVVSWMFWSATGGPSQRWSLVHVVDPAKRHQTLCGRLIPDAFAYHYRLGGDECKKCNKAAAKAAAKDEVQA